MPEERILMAKITIDQGRPRLETWIVEGGQHIPGPAQPGRKDFASALAIATFAANPENRPKRLTVPAETRETIASWVGSDNWRGATMRWHEFDTVREDDETIFNFSSPKVAA